MGFRTLELSQAAELHIKNGQLEILSADGTAAILIEDLGQIMVHGANIRLSTMDLSILSQNKVSVVTLDEKYLPTAIVLPFEGHSRQSKLMHAQILAQKSIYLDLWGDIIRRKILNQSRALSILGSEDAERIAKYVDQVTTDNIDIIEAASAKEYFSLYHEGLNRRIDDPVNSRLNYGYAVVRSYIARTLVATGFHPTFGMMEVEMDDHLGYERSERADRTEIDDYRNGTKPKTINSSYGSLTIDVPQDRNSTFEPKVVKKRQKDISDIDQKIISMYAKGMTTRQISETLQDIYGFEASEGFISDVTDKLLPQIEEWQNRPLDDIYPVLFIDAIHYSVRDNGIIRKLAAYVILGINLEGRKEVLTIEVGQNESSKYWLGVLNSLKNRGVKDILIICADGLTGIKEAIQAAFPETEYQRCIVHQVRNTLKYVADKDKKPFAADLKKIYGAPDADRAEEIRDQVIDKWSGKYPNAMKSWVKNWDAITPIFKFSADVRTVIYTTNAIESLNSTYRKLNRQRSVFPSDQALLKALYLATFEATKKWTMPIRNWGKVYGELSIMYEGRMPA